MGRDARPRGGLARRLAALGRRAGAGVRIAAGLACFLVVSLALDLAFRTSVLPLSAEDPRRARRSNRFVRWWGIAALEIARFFCGTKLSILGHLPEAGRYIIVANHQSSLDVPLLIHIFRRQNLKFVAIDWLGRGKPGVSAALRGGGFARVSQKAVGRDLAELMRFGEELQRFDASAVLFPEGRRTEDGELLPFKFAGVEAVRRTARLPLLPVTLDGLWRARTMRDYLALPGATVTVHVGQPIPPERFDEDPRSAYGALERSIRDTLHRLRAAR